MATPEGANSGSVGSLVSLNDAAIELGLHYMTVYRYVRTGKLHAHKERGQWWVEQAALDALKSGDTQHVAASGKASSRGRAKLVEPFTARLLAGDAGGCWNIVTDALSSGATPVDVHMELLQPALVLVGQRWADGEISISAEHRATSTAQRLLGRLGPLFSHPGRRRGTVVLAMVSGDLHAMPTALLADLLADQHLAVVDLGANTPTESIIETANLYDDLVAIGVTATLGSLVPTLTETLQDLRAALPTARLVTGGPVAVTCRKEVESFVDAIGSDATESASLLASFAARSDTLSG